MSNLKTHSHPPTGRVERKDTKSTEITTDVCQCLIVSVGKARRDMLSRAATNAGWNAVLCADCHNALAAFRRTKFQMALIDLDYEGSTPDGFRDLCQSLSSASTRMLLVICGHEIEPREEIWARQLGVWVYLPGVSLAHADEISRICEQAL